MGIIRKAIVVTGYGALSTVGALAYTTRKCKVHDLPEDDYIHRTTFTSRLRQNFANNPVTSDVCIRKVPIADLKEDYLQPNGKLVERLCAGVWSGLGYAYQRQYLEKKYRAQVPDQLWTTEQLAASDYPVGTHITDHFEVISKTSDSIVVRCGDSPRMQQPRGSDGVFEMVALADKETGEVEFQLKSVFFDSEAAQPNPPMPWHVEIAHRWYSKILLESAVRSLLK